MEQQKRLTLMKISVGAFCFSWKNETAENQPLRFTKNLVKTFLEGKWKKVLFYAAVE